MSYNKWPKRSAEKNYFMVPNEIFSIGLDYREISLYTYLLRCENRETYQCYRNLSNSRVRSVPQPSQLLLSARLEQRRY